MKEKECNIHKKLIHIKNYTNAFKNMYLDVMNVFLKYAVDTAFVNRSTHLSIEQNLQILVSYFMPVKNMFKSIIIFNL